MVSTVWESAASIVPATTSAGPTDEAKQDESRLPGTTLGDLESMAGPPLCVAVDELVESLVERLEGNEQLPGALVIEDGRLLCVVSQRMLSHRMAKGFFRELFVRRTIGQMLSVWDGQTLTIKADSTVVEAVRVALARAPEYRYEPLVVAKPDGGLFLLDLFVLLTQQGRILGESVIELENQRRLILEAEKEKEQLHERIVAASRHAGMAEVATSVLHNVGNVLNGVNVSASVLHKKLTELKVDNLGKAAEMMKSQGESLGEFIQTDERGKQLPRYLGRLAEVFAGEQASMIDEVDALARSIEHIQHIVAAQQEFACGGLIVQQVGLPDLVRDALRINQIALERHGVQVNLELDDCPPVKADKHRVMQILVNLISNAKKAVRDGGKLERIVTVRAGLECPDPVDAEGEKMVWLEVIDNGVGIESENLPKIFNHGFTTRNDGHGFGLHSAANDSRLMGGSLTAHSDGPGTGATFRLRLPAAEAVPASI